MDEELARINAEIKQLEDEKKLLAQIKNAKLTKLKATLARYPARFSAAHPVLSLLGEGAVRAGRGAYNWLNPPVRRRVRA
jgi:hypothetical protein